MMDKQIDEALMSAQTALTSTRYLLDKYCGDHNWIPHIEDSIAKIKKARESIKNQQMTTDDGLKGWREHVQTAYLELRAKNHTIPSEVLEEMRDILLSHRANVHDSGREEAK